MYRLVSQEIASKSGGASEADGVGAASPTFDTGNGSTIAAEKHAMQNRALTTTGCLLGLLVTVLLSGSARAQMLGFPGSGANPQMATQASYMAPANMPPGPSIMQAGYTQPGYPGMMQANGQVAQVGCFCAGGGNSCDAYGGCDSCGYGGCDGCGQGPGGLIGKVCNGNRSGMNGLQNVCPFCRGEGCSICQSVGGESRLGECCAMFGPYTEAGLCAQRWYDVQLEYMMLSMNSSYDSKNVSSLGVGENNAVMSTGDVDFGDMAPGFRLTLSMLFGAGGNLEATYFGTHSYDDTSETFATLDALGNSQFNLFSAFSEFGTMPPGGFDDSDRSSRHSITYQSEIHSIESNYRRRWVGPYCRFQGSWLVGFRYFDLDEDFRFNATGAFNDTIAANNLRFLRSDTHTRNSVFAAQFGSDLWWNIYPGVHLGCGFKGALGGNAAEQMTSIASNSDDNVLNVTNLFEATHGSSTAFLHELQVRGVYRFSYAWSLTAAYWYMGVDGLALGAGNFNTAQPPGRLAGDAFAPRPVSINTDDQISLQGFSIGLEYLW